MGLRTSEGVGICEIPSFNHQVVTDLEPFVVRSGSRLVATPEGRLVLDRVVGELVSAMS